MASLTEGLRSVLGESGAGARQAYFAPTEEGGYEIIPESQRHYRTRQVEGYAQRGQAYAASVPGMTVGSILDSLLKNRAALAGVVGAGLGLGLAFATNASVDTAVAYAVVFALVGVGVVVVLPKALHALNIALPLLLA